MARKRIYKHDVRYKKCGSNWVCKNGHQKNNKVNKNTDVMIATDILLKIQIMYRFSTW